MDYPGDILSDPEQQSFSILKIGKLSRSLHCFLAVERHQPIASPKYSHIYTEFGNHPPTHVRVTILASSISKIPMVKLHLSQLETRLLSGRLTSQCTDTRDIIKGTKQAPLFYGSVDGDNNNLNAFRTSLYIATSSLDCFSKRMRLFSACFGSMIDG
jgi:hypothetical protein